MKHHGMLLKIHKNMFQKTEDKIKNKGRKSELHFKI